MWDGNVQLFKTARSFERACVRAGSSGKLVLCVTARLSRRLLHIYRMEKAAKGSGGWETPPVMSFRRWVMKCYESLWDTRQPLSRCASQRLWHEALEDIPRPSELDVRPSLYTEFQLALDALMDKGLEPSGSESGHALADFRRACTNRFLGLAKQQGFILWAGILKAVSTAVEKGHIDIPPKIVLAGFDDFSPLEESFLTVLSTSSEMTLFQSSAQPDKTVRVRVYATPEQECRAVCAEVLRVWNKGVKNLGVIFLDRDYFPLIKRCFDELAGEERPEFERAIRYNLTVGTSLTQHPLFRTAVIPLRILAEPAPGPSFASLLVSPYIHKTGDNWDRNIRSALWEPEKLLTLDAALSTLSKLDYPVTAFQHLAAMKKARLNKWLAALEDCWKALRFPMFDGEQRPTDALAKQHLYEVKEELSRDAGHVEVDGADALAWLSAAAESIIVAAKTSEITGIQILSLAEARGLAFEHLWVVGTHGAALPRSTREWPLLDPDERRVMDGGSPELQWDQAYRHLSSLCAAAPKICFSRGASRGKEFPYLPCPLILDENAPDSTPIQRHVDLWKNPPAEWMRARWLRLAHIGIDSTVTGSDEPPEPIEQVLSRKWSVTALGDLVSCPFKFFSSCVLQLKPLAKPGAGIDPMLRGEVIHNILKIFVDGLSENAPRWPEDSGEVLKWLKEAADKELSKQPNDIFWRVERVRLLGDKGLPGILHAWLEAESARARDQWRFAGTEVVFNGLKAGGLVLSGRVDRVDCHDTEGFAVWDYKSGALPSASEVLLSATQPQLPAYLLALQRGLLQGYDPGNSPLHAGYIPLKKAADVQVKFLKSAKKGAVDWPAFLRQWEDNLAQCLEAPQKGFFDAIPRPETSASFQKRKGACEYCEFYNLCGYFDRQQADQEPARTDANEEEQ